MALDDLNGALLNATHDRFDFLRVEPLVHGRIAGEIREENGGRSAFA
jgi:hypothetical protein